MTKNIDYSKGKIYKIEPIIDHDEGDIYIGSTTKEYLSQRMTKHRGDYSQWIQGKHNKTTSYDLFEKYGINNCRIILIEKVNATSKDELISREAFYIRTMKCINKTIPDRKSPEYHKEYYNTNKIEINKKKHEHYLENREKYLDYQKKYKEENDYKLKERKQKYYEENKEILKEKQKQILVCECGCSIQIYKIQRHRRTKKHNDLMNKINI